MPKEPFKDVTVEGKEYRIGRVSASVGNWIMLQLDFGKSAEEATYNKIQGYLFEKISQYQMVDGVNGAPATRMPMLVYQSGRFLNQDVEFDLDVLNGLYRAAMGFNFDDFFAKRLAEFKKEQAEKEKAQRLIGTPATTP